MAAPWIESEQQAGSTIELNREGRLRLGGSQAKVSAKNVHIPSTSHKFKTGT